jgi:hypothetical protein
VPLFPQDLIVAKTITMAKGTVVVLPQPLQVLSVIVHMNGIMVAQIITITITMAKRTMAKGAILVLLQPDLQLVSIILHMNGIMVARIVT